MIRDLRTELENTPEGRIAARAYVINDRIFHQFQGTGNAPRFADRADYREGLKLYVKRELLAARREEIEQSHEKLAIDKGRKLYLLDRALQLQKEIDAVNAEITRLEAA